MNLANKLTFSRVLVIPFFVSFLLAGNITNNLAIVTTCHWLALVTFVGATITDYYDGVIARRTNTSTAFGELFDPLADKLLTMAAFVSFVELRVPSDRPIFPAWAIIIILGREFLVTGLRSVATMRGRVIKADRWGKHKTGWQLGTIIGILVFLCIRDTMMWTGMSVEGFDRVLPYIFRGALSIVVALTVISGAVYLRNNWDVIRDDD
ncbi:MAG: CDP-diacylglycerol--glycerol-3-phosphate 3-phosphatidyltransferase [Candidatus Sumerlaeaceae bacterium]|nr:CDP-diacylglycerol--glycerol-3-phosphate 3-phosphatidyltransferase [Candidatus Sumerlaeaceae bacterium]